MDFYFVYSSGGGAGDWNGINRVWNEFMPSYFRDNLLIKFGDIFFNHKGLNRLTKPQLWNNISNARTWLIERTRDSSLATTPNLIMDVGTTKIVNYIACHYSNLSPEEVIEKFDEVLNEELILDKYGDFILESNINNAVTFDIPNPFKIRNQSGNTIRNIFTDSNCKNLLVSKCIQYANHTYSKLENSNRLLVLIPSFLSENEIESYLSRLNFTPQKIAIGALIDLNDSDFTDALTRLSNKLNLSDYTKVHFLGCGGLKKANLIKRTLGNHSNFSVDNTTAYNRSIDGNTSGSSQSCYYDYNQKSMIRITPSAKNEILRLHTRTATNIKLFSDAEMKIIIESVLEHQSNNSSQETYNNRAKLVIHNFDVFKYNAL